MKTVTIVTQFTLTLNDATTRKFAPGVYELEDDIADHFFVRVHSKDAPYIEPLPGTPEGAALAAKRMQRRKILDAAAEIHAEDARRGAST